MNKFIELVESFIAKKIDFKEFDKKWLQLYNFSGTYENLSDQETFFLDEIDTKEDMVSIDEKELEDLKKYNFISVEEFRHWLKKYLMENKLR